MNVNATQDEFVDIDSDTRDEIQELFNDLLLKQIKQDMSEINTQVGNNHVLITDSIKKSEKRIKATCGEIIDRLKDNSDVLGSPDDWDDGNLKYSIDEMCVYLQKCGNVLNDMSKDMGKLESILGKVSSDSNEIKRIMELLAHIQDDLTTIKNINVDNGNKIVDMDTENRQLYKDFNKRNSELQEQIKDYNDNIVELLTDSKKIYMEDHAKMENKISEILKDNKRKFIFFYCGMGILAVLNIIIMLVLIF